MGREERERVIPKIEFEENRIAHNLSPAYVIKILQQ
jgi:hypothetical protein